MVGRDHQAAQPFVDRVGRVDRIIRERLETFDEDAKAARPWEDVLADLKARRPLPPSRR